MSESISSVISALAARILESSDRVEIPSLGVVLVKDKDGNFVIVKAQEESFEPAPESSEYAWW